MLSQKMIDEINLQIKLELYSAYLYLSMSAHFEAANLGGFAIWMKAQAGEEQQHALKFLEHLQDRGGKVVLQAIEQPPVDFGKPLAIFEEVLKHEESVTARIHHMYSVAVTENDYASQSYLTWFVNEQVEEEKHATQIVEWLKMAGDSTNALFMLDSVLRKRGG
jgi:ferritin